MSRSGAHKYIAIASGDSGIAWSEKCTGEREAIWQACHIADYSELDASHHCVLIRGGSLDSPSHSVDPLDYGWGSEEYDAWLNKWRGRAQWIT
jgi:hypothetical protein